jgi:hypothetical protein
LIDATAFDFSSRGLTDWSAMLVLIEDNNKTGNSESELPVFVFRQVKYLSNKLAFYDKIFNFNLNIFS